MEPNENKAKKQRLEDENAKQKYEKSFTPRDYQVRHVSLLY